MLGITPKTISNKIKKHNADLEEKSKRIEAEFQRIRKEREEFDAQVREINIRQFQETKKDTSTYLVRRVQYGTQMQFMVIER